MGRGKDGGRERERDGKRAVRTVKKILKQDDPPLSHGLTPTPDLGASPAQPAVGRKTTFHTYTATFGAHASQSRPSAGVRLRA